MAEKMNLKNFEYGNNDLSHGDIGKIVGKEYHEYTGKKLCAVRMNKSKKDIIIEEAGVKYYKYNFLGIDESLFRI